MYTWWINDFKVKWSLKVWVITKILLKSIYPHLYSLSPLKCEAVWVMMDENDPISLMCTPVSKVDLTGGKRTLSTVGKGSTGQNGNGKLSFYSCFQFQTWINMNERILLLQGFKQNIQPGIKTNDETWAGAMLPLKCLLINFRVNDKLIPNSTLFPMAVLPTPHVNHFAIKEWRGLYVPLTNMLKKQNSVPRTCPVTLVTLVYIRCSLIDKPLIKLSRIHHPPSSRAPSSDSIGEPGPRE